MRFLLITAVVSIALLHFGTIAGGAGWGESCNADPACECGAKLTIGGSGRQAFNRGGTLPQNCELPSDPCEGVRYHKVDGVVPSGSNLCDNTGNTTVILHPYDTPIACYSDGTDYTSDFYYYAFECVGGVCCIDVIGWPQENSKSRTYSFSTCEDCDGSSDCS